MKQSVFIVAFAVVSSVVLSQNSAPDSLLSNFEDEQTQLLPDRIFITQRLLWGKKGLLRVTKISPLTVEQRQVELNVRRTMLKLHQAAGFITLAGMVAQGIVGAKLYSNPTPELRDAHENLAIFVNAGYATTALLSFTAPPPLINRRGITPIKLHKALAMVHLSGMIATNILGDWVEDNPNYKPYHRAAAYTTFTSFATAVVVIKF